MIEFASPWFLLLLLAVPVAAWWSARPRRRPAVLYSSTMLLEAVRPTWRVRFRRLPGALVAVGAALLIVGLARPRLGIGEVRTRASAVAIMIVVDRSASMQLPMRFAGKFVPRIDAAKQVFKDFVAGDGRELKGRREDLVGLVTFARFPETVCPLVRIHDTLLKLVDGITLAEDRWEGGTAIGDGLALAAARLKKAEEELAARNRRDPDPNFSIRSKVIVLLTDGDENVGETRAAQAAQLCREWGIRIYAVGIGDDSGGTVRVGGARVAIGRGGGFDEELLRSITRATDGAYWRATDGEALRRAASAIDELEKTIVESKEFTSYRERFMPWAAWGAGLVAAGLFLSSTVLRRSP